MKKGVVVVLLAGGVGSRMNSPIPKQYLALGDKPIALYSFDIFQQFSDIIEIVVVCDPSYQELFKLKNQNQVLTFAFPGKRRQDSTFNGFSAIQSSASLICIHDSARPFIDVNLITQVIEAGREFRAATLGVPLKYTIKSVTKAHFVSETLERDTLWEIQTPQVICKDLLKKGFFLSQEQNLIVTDEATLIEKLGLQVKIVEGAYKNIKITTQEDLYFAEQLLKK